MRKKIIHSGNELRNTHAGHEVNHIVNCVHALTSSTTVPDHVQRVVDWTDGILVVATAAGVGGEASVLGRKLTKKERHMQAFSLTVTQRLSRPLLSVLGRKLEER